jgi:hypothetical protein
MKRASWGRVNLLPVGGYHKTTQLHFEDGPPRQAGVALPICTTRRRYGGLTTIVPQGDGRG